MVIILYDKAFSCQSALMPLSQKKKNLCLFQICLHLCDNYSTSANDNFHESHGSQSIPILPIVLVILVYPLEIVIFYKNGEHNYITIVVYFNTKQKQQMKEENEGEDTNT